MDTTAIFEECFNNIIANKYQDSYYAFTDNYYKYPNQAHFLYGVIISYLLAKNVRECCHFLQTEAPVSPLSYKISLILAFIKKNNYFPDLSEHDLIFNVGLLLRKKNLAADGHIFFRTCQHIKPGNPKTLALLAESAILQNDHARGIKLFSQAATSI